MARPAGPAYPAPSQRQPITTGGSMAAPNEQDPVEQDGAGTPEPQEPEAGETSGGEEQEED